MESKEFAVRCPCCESRLAIDVRTRKVMRWSRPSELDETGKPRPDGRNWDTALGRVSGREREASDKFDSALSKEKNRARDLDDLFRKAEEKVRREDGDEDD